MTTHYAIVFPGQGSQSIGMLSDIADRYPEVKNTFAEAADVLHYDLWKLIQEGPAEKLDTTTYTQPALLASSYAIWRILKANFSLQPAFLAGHSLGEYTALLCADALNYADALQLVAARGQFMQEAVQPGVGAMAAILGLDDNEVKVICEETKQADEVLSPANYNSIGQVVIAGHKEAVTRAMALAKEKGAKLCVLIPVSVPSHCELMQPAAERLSPLLHQIAWKKPTLPVINNADVLAYETIDSICDGLTRQLTSPVRWVETIQAFSAAGIQQIIECGPGKILTGVNKRINKNLQLLATFDLTNLETLNVL